MNVVVRGQVKSENSSLPVGVRVSETCLLKLPNVSLRPGSKEICFTALFQAIVWIILPLYAIKFMAKEMNGTWVFITLAPI